VSQPQLVTLRSGDVVRIRQVRPDDRPALIRAYANLGEQSRYRRFFTVMPELPEATLKAAVEVDHVNHEALVALPVLSAEIIGECRFIRQPDQPDTAEIGVTVVDAWQGRGLGSALLARLSERAAETRGFRIRQTNPATAIISRTSRIRYASLPARYARITTATLTRIVASGTPRRAAASRRRLCRTWTWLSASAGAGPSGPGALIGRSGRVMQSWPRLRVAAQVTDLDT